MKRFSFLMFLMILTLISCRDETLTVDKTTIPIEGETNYEVTVFGTVKDEAGLPVENAEVTVDNQSFVTDENGLFVVDKTYAGNFGTQLSAKKEGYLYGGYRLYADHVGTNQVEIVLMQAKDLGNVTPSTGAKIDITPNTSLTFPTDAFTLDGNPFIGNVNVYGNWIDPTSDDLMSLTPGDLSGLNADQERVILSSFGMMGIELRTDSGMEVEIAEGKNVELTFEVPSNILSFAPSTIPLWTFDEVEGIWIEEGSASLQGNQYVGNVSHFSWWNCDLPNDVLPFCIKITNEKTGEPLANTRVYFKNLDGFGQAGGYTDSRGFLCGFIPENVQMEVTIGDPDLCPGQLPMKVVGPFTTSDLPILIECQVDLGDVLLNTITGSVTDCATGEPIANAFVLFESENGVESTITDVDGNYTQDIWTCGELEELNINAIDLVSEKEENQTLTDLTGGSHTANLPLCDDFLAAAWFIQHPDQVVQYTDVEAKIKPHESLIIVNGAGELLGFECFDIGTCSGSYIGELGPIEVVVEVLEFGNIGGAIKGTFTGTTVDGDAINGSFTANRVE